MTQRAFVRHFSDLLTGFCVFRRIREPLTEKRFVTTLFASPMRDRPNLTFNPLSPLLRTQTDAWS